METACRQAADLEQSCAAGTSGQVSDLPRTGSGAIDMDAYTERARRLRRAAINKGLDDTAIALVRQAGLLASNLRRSRIRITDLIAPTVEGGRKKQATGISLRTLLARCGARLAALLPGKDNQVAARQ